MSGRGKSVALKFPFQCRAVLPRTSTLFPGLSFLGLPRCPFVQHLPLANLLKLSLGVVPSGPEVPSLMQEAVSRSSVSLRGCLTTSLPPPPSTPPHPTPQTPLSRPPMSTPSSAFPSHRAPFGFFFPDASISLPFPTAKAGTDTFSMRRIQVVITYCCFLPTPPFCPSSCRFYDFGTFTPFLLF